MANALEFTKGIHRGSVPALGTIDEFYLDNVFKLYFREGKLFYNLSKKVTFPDDIDPSYYETITYNANEPLTNLSYRMYNTQHLWWLILYTNNIFNPFEMPESGTLLKVLTPGAVRAVLDQIQLDIVASQ